MAGGRVWGSDPPGSPEGCLAARWVGQVLFVLPTVVGDSSEQRRSPSSVFTRPPPLTPPAPLPHPSCSSALVSAAAATHSPAGAAISPHSLPAGVGSPLGLPAHVELTNARVSKARQGRAGPLACSLRTSGRRPGFLGQPPAAACAILMRSACPPFLHASRLPHRSSAPAHHFLQPWSPSPVSPCLACRHTACHWPLLALCAPWRCAPLPQQPVDSAGFGLCRSSPATARAVLW